MKYKLTNYQIKLLKIAQEFGEVIRGGIDETLVDGKRAPYMSTLIKLHNLGYLEYVPTFSRYERCFRLTKEGKKILEEGLYELCIVW